MSGVLPITDEGLLDQIYIKNNLSSSSIKENASKELKNIPMVTVNDALKSHNVVKSFLDFSNLTTKSIFDSWINLHYHFEREKSKPSKQLTISELNLKKTNNLFLNVF